MRAADLAVPVGGESRANQVPFIREEKHGITIRRQVDAAPFFRSVTVLVCQTCWPVPASRQTISPEDLAENTYPPRKRAVEVLLRILFEAVLVSGQSTEAVG